jgi:LemA protein
MFGTLVLLGILGVLAGLAVSLYNRLVRLRNGAEGAWSDIDVQLKRRHNLIPNLVETVKGYAGHEQKTLSDVTEARGRARRGQRAFGSVRRRECAHPGDLASVRGGRGLPRSEGEPGIPAAPG